MLEAAIIREVKICIDEIGINDADFLGGQDDAEMDTIIRSKILDALRYVHGNSDWALLEPDVVINSSTSGVSVTDLVGKVILPANFMRLCYARFRSWPVFLSDPIYWNDKEYATLSDRHSTGTWERPKLAMVLYPSRTLELYSAKSDVDDIEVGIVLEPEMPAEGGDVKVSSKLTRALIYYTAGLTLMTYSEQRADDMFNQAMALMGVSSSKNEN